MSEQNQDQEKKDLPVPAGLVDDLVKDIKQEQEKESKPSETEEKVKQGAVRNTEKQSVTVEYDTNKEGSLKHREEVLVSCGATSEEVTKRLSTIREDEVSKLPGAADWAEVAGRGMLTNSYKGFGMESLSKPGGDYRQVIKFSNMNLGPSSSKPDVERGEIVAGVRALDMLQRHVGIGGNFTIPLWHSGFWISLKPVAEETWLELHRQIQNIKTSVGRDTYGLMLSANNGLINEIVCRYALMSMSRTSAKDVDDILKILSIHDINLLMWGYMCTMYPNGFNHKVACVADPSKCVHVVDDILNVRRLMFTDRSRLSDAQLTHMTKSSQSSMKPEEIEAYRKEHQTKEEKVITLAEGTEEEIKITLAVPSAFDYFEATNRWINSISTKVLQSLGAESTNQERNVVITQHATSTTMRKFGHWVKRIEASAVIEDKETIEESLDFLSTSKVIRDDFDKQVNEYIESTCLALIGIPDFKCPSCGNYQITEEDTDPLHRNIIPLDITSVFFQMLVQRVQSVSERQE